MFSRKRRVASNPSFGSGPKANASAQTAAALAFLNPQASNASLSAAAAAAALRARPTTPTSVADVQTKRTMRRTNSNSSMGSSVSGSTRGPPGAQLERRGSSGSMTERTFRDPSPSRGSTRPSLDNAPPVPTIPKNLPPALPTKSHRRAASMETPILPRVASPLPNPATGRGSSLEPYRGIQTPRRPAQRISSLSSVQELTGIERPNSRGSVNFSYPARFREMAQYGQRQLTSPTPSSASQRTATAQKHNLVYDPNTRTFMPEAELLFIEQSIQDASEKPVRRKKKIAPQSGTGTHLSDGTVGGRIQGTAIIPTNTTGPKSKDDEEPHISPQPTSTTAPRKKKKALSTSKPSNEVETHTPSLSDYDSDNSEKPMKSNTRAGMLLAKKPSIVREDREREEAEDDTSKASDRQATLKKLESRSSDARPVSPTSLPKPYAPMGHGRGLSSVSIDNAQIQPQTRTVSQPVPTFSTESTATSALVHPTVDTAEGDTGNAKSARVHSLSPVRNAHFLTTPESLAVRHQPPARSVSPRKSALKHSPSSRGNSPSGETPVGSSTNRVSMMSETSDSSTVMSEERAPPKKKSVRVSFDDDSNVVLGQADTPVTSDTPLLQSPQGKRGWFSGVGRGRTKDLGDMDDNDDQIMKPRPALPSFGSVREKKSREAEERPLVKPIEPSTPATQLPPPLFTTATGEAIQHSLGPSSDHAAGSVLIHDHLSKNAANISDSREPLPPEVTSVEGSGYISDSGSSIGTNEHIIESSVPIHNKTEIRPVPVVEEKSDEIHGELSGSSITSSTAPSREEPEIPSAKSNGNGTIPSFALTQASPTIEETEKDGQFPYVIGGFPSSSESGLDDSQESIVERKPTDLSPSAVGISEPEPTVRPDGSPAVGDIAAHNLPHHSSVIEEDPDESDSDSIYSDAAEDLSDMQGDGFMSLDAVVESPIVPKVLGLPIPTLPDSPTRDLKESSQVKSTFSAEPREPEREEGWEKAQEYWSGLTAEKKKELERAAREETDMSSEEEVKPAPKPKKSKKVFVKSPPASPQVNEPRTEFFHERTYQIKPGAKAGQHGPAPIMRSSMRAAHHNSDDTFHMRSSLRTPPPSAEEPVLMRRSMRDSGSIRGSMRGTSEASAASPQAKASLQKKYQPMSVSQPDIKPSSPKVEKYVKSMPSSSASAPPIAKPTPTLRRKGSAESDSSFKRARPVTQGYSMKRSMRGPEPQQAFARPLSPELPASNVRSSRFNLRSLSPNGSIQRDTPTAGLGRTLRNNHGLPSNSTGPTLRSQAPDSPKSISRFSGFGRPKAGPKPKAVPTRASRFADSSDEEDIRTTFRSRFIDSDDEEDDFIPAPTASEAPIALRNSIRRPDVIDDSSDLPDTDDEKPSKQSKSAKVVVPPARTATPTHGETALASGSLRRSGSGRDFIGATTTTSITAGPMARPSQKRRGSFMSILRRKKPDPASKIQKLDGESGARRDTPLERTRADLRAVRQDSNFSTASEATSPKLQKRGASKRTDISGALENWPLSSPHPDTEDVGLKDGRQLASDEPDISEKQLENGAAHAVSGKPDLGPRRTTSTGLAGVDLSTVVPPKKKKFGMLRRAFRLDD